MLPNENLNVLFITTTYPRRRGDFRGIFVHRLARALVQAGLQVTTLAPAGDQTVKFEKLDRVAIHRFYYWLSPEKQCVAYGEGILVNLKKSWLARLQFPFFCIVWIVRCIQLARFCDLIHAHWLPSALIALLAKRIYGCPVVLTVRGTDVRSLPKKLTKFLASRVDALIALGPEQIRLLEAAGILQERIHTIPTMLDYESFNHRTVDRGCIRSELDLGRSPVVSFVGRLGDFKDPLTLVHSIPLVLKERPDVKFLIVGDGPLRGTVERAVVALALREAVIITGPRSDIARILAGSDIFVSLSPVENIWSNSLVEAITMKVPCVVTDVGCTTQVFTHQKDAILIPPQEPRALAKAILRLLDDPQMRHRLIDNALKALERWGFGREKILSETLRMYHSVLNGKATV